MNNNNHMLVVRKQFLNDETISEHAATLSSNKLVDAYHARLMLKGVGLAVLAKAKAADLEPIGEDLSDLGYQWFIVPSKRRKLPVREVSSFKVHKERIVVLDKDEGGVTIEKDSRILMIVAGTRGKLIKKLLAKSTLAKNGVSSLDNTEKYKSIMAGKPVVDIYVLPRSLQGDNLDRFVPLRFLPGKFNPESLGKHATKSAVKNMDVVARIFKSFAGQVHIEMDFGMFQMPNCQLEVDEDNPRAFKRTLNSISVYGYYLLNLYQQDEQHKAHQEFDSDMMPAAGLVAGEVARSLEVGGYDQHHKHENQAEQGEVLPAPPKINHNTRLSGYFSPGNIFLILLLIIHVFGFSALAFFSDAARELFIYWGKDRGLVFLMIAIAMFISAFKYLKLKRYMDDTPTSKARSVAMGMVEMAGTTRRAYNLFSPVTGTPCVYYRVKKYSRVESRNGAQHWMLVSDQESSSVPFILQDETGTVHVNPEGASIRASYKQTINNGFAMARPGAVPVDPDSRYVEELIPEFTKIYVLGFAEPMKPAVKSIARRVAEKLRLLKQDTAKMEEYDTNKDGRIDEQEYEVARSEMEYEALKDALSEKNNTHEQKVMIKQNKKGKLPFVISKSSEKTLTRRYQYLSFGLFLAALILLVLGMVRALQLV